MYHSFTSGKYFSYHPIILMVFLQFFTVEPTYSQYSNDSLSAQHYHETNQSARHSALYKTIAAPTILIAGGVFTFYNNPILDRFEVQQARQRAIPNFRTHADDYLNLAPIAAVYGLDLVGVKAQHQFMNRTWRLLAAELLSNGITFPLKTLTHIERPDGSNFYSFPSGHTNQAFVAATFMHKELGHLSPWYSIGAYTTATAVGALRIMNNKHWISDVLVGAGVGILSTNIVYLLFQDQQKDRHQEKHSSILLLPGYNSGSIGFNMLVTLH